MLTGKYLLLLTCFEPQSTNGLMLRFCSHGGVVVYKIVLNGHFSTVHTSQTAVASCYDRQFSSCCMRLRKPKIILVIVRLGIACSSLSESYHIPLARSGPSPISWIPMSASLSSRSCRQIPGDTDTRAHAKKRHPPRF